jgi:hypothetical protein
MGAPQELVERAVGMMVEGSAAVIAHDHGGRVDLLRLVVLLMDAVVADVKTTIWPA